MNTILYKDIGRERRNHRRPVAHRAVSTFIRLGCIDASLTRDIASAHRHGCDGAPVRCRESTSATA